MRVLIFFLGHKVYEKDRTNNMCNDADTNWVLVQFVRIVRKILWSNIIILLKLCCFFISKKDEFFIIDVGTIFKERIMVISKKNIG